MERGIIRCRPHRGNWFLVLMLGGFGAAFPWLARSARNAPYSANDWLGVWLIAVAFLAAAFVLAAWLLYTEIAADEDSLRWRKRGQWQSARWEDVTDYYDQITPQGQKTTIPAVIQTGAGPVKFHRDWSNFEALRERVQRAATQAGTDRWQILGTRQQDTWPRLFDYDTSDNRRTPLLLVSLGLPFIAFLLFRILSKVPSILQEMGWGWGLGMIATGALVTLLHAAILFPVGVAYQDARRRRRGQKITASPEGICFENGAECIHAAWNEVTGVTIASFERLSFLMRYVVITSQGTFDFTHLLRDVRLLTQIIKRYAPAAVEQASSVEDVLGGLSDRWSGGREGVGERVYHYRTRTNRALLWLLSSFPALCALTATLTAHGLTRHQNIRPSLWVGGILLAATLWGWWRYYSASVRTDEEGVTQNAPFRHHRIRWRDIDDYYQSREEPLTFGNVIGRGVHIQFWTGSITDADELKAEITRRALYSRRTAWEQSRYTA